MLDWIHDVIIDNMRISFERYAEIANECINRSEVHSHYCNNSHADDKWLHDTYGMFDDESLDALDSMMSMKHDENCNYIIAVPAKLSGRIASYCFEPDIAVKIINAMLALLTDINGSRTIPVVEAYKMCDFIFAVKYMLETDNGSVLINEMIESCRNNDYSLIHAVMLSLDSLPIDREPDDDFIERLRLNWELCRIAGNGFGTYYSDGTMIGCFDSYDVNILESCVHALKTDLSAWDDERVADAVHDFNNEVMTARSHIDPTDLNTNDELCDVFDYILSDIPSLSDDVLVVLMHVIAIMSSVEYGGDNSEFNNMLHDRLLFNAVIDDVIHHGMPVEYAMEHVKIMEN